MGKKHRMAEIYFYEIQHLNWTERKEEIERMNEWEYISQHFPGVMVASLKTTKNGDHIVS